MSRPPFMPAPESILEYRNTIEAAVRAQVAAEIEDAANWRGNNFTVALAVMEVYKQCAALARGGADWSGNGFTPVPAVAAESAEHDNLSRGGAK